jgi:hypothetical protein
VPVVSPAEAQSAFEGKRPQVVFVDDADRCELPPELTSALTAAHTGPTLVASASLESFALGVSSSLHRRALSGARVVLALCPLDRGTARNVGMELAFGQSITGPHGRALALVDGTTELVQVSSPD